MSQTRTRDSNDEQWWLTATKPLTMIRWITHGKVVSDGGAQSWGSPDLGPAANVSERKLRLIACAVARHGGCGSWKAEAKIMLLAAERMADNGSHDLNGDDIDEGLIAEYLLRPDAAEVVRHILHHYEPDPEDREAGPAQAAIIRDIAGNPFRPITVDPAWRTPDVLALASAAYERRTADGTLDDVRQAVLADALEEAGCTDEEILRHLRGLPARLPCNRCCGTGMVKGTIRDYSRVGEGFKTTNGRRPCDAFVMHDGKAYRRCKGGWVDMTDRGTPHYRGCFAIDAILGR